MGLGYLVGADDDWPIQRALAERNLATGPELVAATPEAWLADLGALPLMHHPGAVWQYDTAFDVLGILLARAAGQPLETLLRERLFDPLDMKDTGFQVPASDFRRLPPCHASDFETGGLRIFDPAGAASRWSQPPNFASARGGLVSTVDDYLAFARMLLNQGRYGKQRILSRPAVALMTADHLTPEQRAGAALFLGANRSWGLGVAIITRRDELAATPGRFGWDGGYGCTWASDPAEDFTAILLSQRLWDAPTPPAVYLDFWTAAYAALND